jgi:hypothetical protein
MFYGLSTNHDFWVERLNLFVALAPVLKMENTGSTFIRSISKIQRLLEQTYTIFKTPELFQRGKKYDRNFCRFVPLCGTITNFLDNVLNPFDDPKISVSASAHFPNGASL